jgi:hypothetical protein
LRAPQRRTNGACAAWLSPLGLWIQTHIGCSGRETRRSCASECPSSREVRTKRRPKRTKRRAKLRFSRHERAKRRVKRTKRRVKFGFSRHERAKRRVKLFFSRHERAKRRAKFGFSRHERAKRRHEQGPSRPEHAPCRGDHVPAALRPSGSGPLRVKPPHVPMPRPHPNIVPCLCMLVPRLSALGALLYMMGSGLFGSRTLCANGPGPSEAWGRGDVSAAWALDLRGSGPGGVRGREHREPRPHQRTVFGLVLSSCPGRSPRSRLVRSPGHRAWIEHPGVYEPQRHRPPKAAASGAGSRRYTDTAVLGLTSARAAPAAGRGL